MLGAAYFSAFIVAILSFPDLPTRPLKVAGLIWASGLAISLTYLSPFWCWVCLGAHGCHLLMWIIWKPAGAPARHFLGVKLSLVFTSALAAAALFSTLNTTFLIYGLSKPSGSLVKKGSRVKSFALETLEKKPLSDALLNHSEGTLFNFVSANCPYCKDQLPRLDSLANQFYEQGFRFLSITQSLASDWQPLAPHLEWVEDREGALASLFGIEGYPTLVLVDSQGVIIKIFSGASSSLEKEVGKSLALLARKNAAD